MRWIPAAPSRDRLADGAAFTFFLAIAALSTRYSTPLLDDVHITLRHSLNLARGNGLVYNPGERLLGASSPAYAVLLAALVPIFRNPVVPAVYLWPCTLAAAAFLAYRLAGRGPLGVGVGIVLCTDPGLQAIVGMETTFYVAVLFLILASFEAGRLEAVAFLLGLLPMVRPDGVFLVAAVVLVWLLENRASLGRAFLRRHARLAGLFLLPLGVWCLVATAYYGRPLPNSFIAKSYQSKVTWWWSDHMTFRFEFREQLGELRYRLISLGALLGSVVALFRTDRVLRAGSLFIVFYVAAFGISRVPGYPNYFFPVFAMMTMLGFRALGVVSDLVSSRLGVDASKTAFVRLHAAATVATTLVAFATILRASDLQLFSAPGPPDPNMAYVKIARYLKDHVPKDASVAAMEIGIIGYYSESKIVDFAGLVSPGVMPAVASGNRRFVLGAFQPDYVVARYPTPLALEGGLTEDDLAANYHFLYGAGGVGVFRAVRPPKGGRWDISSDADRLNAYPGTVFIAKQSIDQEQLEALDHAVAPHGSLLVRSLSGEERDVSLKRHAYASFREGHVEAIEPLLEASEVEAVARLPALEFNARRENFGAWRHVKTRRAKDSMVYVTTNNPDSYLSVPIARFAPWLAGRLRIRMRVTRSSCANGSRDGAIYWLTDRDKTWGARDKQVPFFVPTNGKWHEIRVDLTQHAAWNGSGLITDLRYDPLHCVAELDVDYFRLE